MTEIILFTEVLQIFLWNDILSYIKVHIIFIICNIIKTKKSVNNYN